ncbi:outer membrane beta-barrel protein [Costertonia aggregata]|uniref:Outer membrane beta-barrel protein n=1 Tax=Costertonia aggregata TaxID=343403 RepID=A0A7H9APJ8_9FLAO|nr:outer membrane beta-barrel protein [Costertonia aggregata]QLG45313.1 outer membrane beta-barrel protein [Costertonia aggregata]
MNKKNIDNLFQEKFRDFGEVPDERVWASIEASLNQKKSRRMIPFWWQIGGVAALLALMLYVINPFGGNPSGNTTPIITDVENASENTIQKTDTLQDDANQEQQDIDQGVADSKKNDNAPKIDAAKDRSSQKQHSYANKDNAKEKAGTKKQHPKNIHPNEIQKNLTGKKEQITETDNKQQQVPKKDGAKTDLDGMLQKKKEGIAITDDVKTNGKINPAQNLEKERSAILDSKNNEKEAVVTHTAKEEKEDPKKKSIFEEIEKKQQEEEAVVENSTKDKWSAGPSVAPVYFNALGEGSPVHSIFVPNGKSGNVNLSYGLTVAYEISDRLSLRSGIHKVDYGYDTNDVSFSSSLDGSTNDQIDNISYRATSKNLVLNSRAAPEASFQNPSDLDTNAISPERNGIMSQQFGYLEVPLELNYALVNKKVGVNLVGGFSSLFLVDNSVSVEGGGQVMELGEANNINSINFSANAGIGVDYKFSSKVKLNLEPVFKYQLNTFSETDGTFQPFSVGVYSGLTFKF